VGEDEHIPNDVWNVSTSVLFTWGLSRGYIVGLKHARPKISWADGGLFVGGPTGLSRRSACVRQACVKGL
jgi:hypothetical protein